MGDVRPTESSPGFILQESVNLSADWTNSPEWTDQSGHRPCITASEILSTQKAVGGKSLEPEFAMTASKHS